MCLFIFENSSANLKMHLAKKYQVFSNAIKNKAYKHQEDVKKCHSNFRFQMLHSNRKE